MLYFLSSKTLLLVSTGLRGGLWTLSALLSCFLAMHFLLWIKNKKEIKPQSNTPPPQKTKPDAEKKAPATQEPIYYIVEKKRRRAKSSYGEPKEIRFR